MADLPEIHEALVIRPGDQLLVRVHQSTHPEDAKRLIDSLKEKLPDGVEVCVIGAEQLAVVRG